MLILLPNWPPLAKATSCGATRVGLTVNPSVHEDTLALGSRLYITVVCSLAAIQPWRFVGSPDFAVSASGTCLGGCPDSSGLATAQLAAAKRKGEDQLPGEAS